MEATSVCNTKGQNFTQFLQPSRKGKMGNSASSLRFKKRVFERPIIRCEFMGQSPSSTPLSAEEEEAEEWLKMGDFAEKCCKDRKDMVELLECLEEEAIMGDDEGKEPVDYNRRAHLFDKSSRVFQALRDKKKESSVCHE